MTVKRKKTLTKIGMVPLIGCRCRCGHEWLPRGNKKPRVCPTCKSPNWDREKLFTRRKTDTNRVRTDPS